MHTRYWEATITVSDLDGTRIDQYQMRSHRDSGAEARKAFHAAAHAEYGDTCKVRVTRLRERIFDASH